jgi:ABC-2 type transport system ATP-binding protein
VDPVIEVEGLEKRYADAVAVAGVSFRVDRGEVFGLLGRNGAGKTTTVECVTEALRLFAAFADHPADLGLLQEQWGLAGKANASFASLSGGQQQRLFVALALVNDPEVVFLDEMTTGLDPGARREAWNLIRAIRDRGTTVVLVTHFMDEAEQLCDRLAVMDAGRIIAEGSPQELIESHTGPRRVLFSTDHPDLAFLTEVPGVEAVTRRARQVVVTGRGPLLALLAASLVEHGLAPADLRVERPTLEDVFLGLTGGRTDEA